MSYPFQTIRDKACQVLEGATCEAVVDNLLGLLEEPDPEMIRAGIGALNAGGGKSAEIVVRAIWHDMLRKASE